MVQSWGKAATYNTQLQPVRLERRTHYSASPLDMDRKRPISPTADDAASSSNKFAKIEISGVADFSCTENSYNVYNTDNRVDNRVDNSVTNNTVIHRRVVYQQVRSRQADQERISKVLQMLSPLEPLKRHQDIQSSRCENTGTWVLEHGRFQAWRDGIIHESVEEGPDNFLCCYGMPGAGKTVMCSLAIDHLTLHYGLDQRLKVGVACLYCDYRDQEKQTLDHILGSFIHQLLLPQRAPQQVLASVINLIEDINRQHKNIQTKDIYDMLKQTVQQFDCIFMCIDALDELTQQTRNQLLKLLKNFTTELTNVRLRLFLTGRHHIEAELNRILQIHPRNSIVIEAKPDDIRAYLSYQIEEDISPEAMSEQLKAEILSIIPAQSKGMFLLPVLHIYIVMEQQTIARRRKALQTLPSDLYSTFEVSVRRIQQSPRHAELGMQVLMWLHLAHRPLKWMELAHALAVEKDTTNLDQDNIPARRIVLDSCFGLVIVDDETLTVRFVHYTLEEYLRAQSKKYFPDGFTRAAEICLTYLNFDRVSLCHNCSTKQDLNEKKTAYPFFEYASYYWGYYVKEQDDDYVRTLALKLLRQDGHCAICSLSELITQRSPFIAGFSVTHVLAYFGMDKLIGHIPNEQRWDSADEFGKTPLSWAAENGHAGVVRLLVDRKDIHVVDSKDIHGRTPLSWAAGNGQEDVVQLLVDREDVVADSEDRYFGQTPLSWAARNGHEGIVRLLVNRPDVVVDLRDDDGRTPLAWAARYGHEGVVRLLIEREDVVADSRDEYGQTPLSWAAESGHEGVVQLLLEREDVMADPRERNYGLTPLSYAARNGHEGIVRLLVDRADVVADPRDDDGRTPLSWAARNGHEGVARLLVDRADVVADSRDGDGRTPLSWAAEHGHEGVVRLLIDRHDVVADSRDNDGRTPLSWAAENGQGGVVRLLVDRKDVMADSRAIYYGLTPLSYAARNGHEGVVRLLVEREDIVADSRDDNGRTPLAWAARNGYEGIVKLLIDREDVDADSRDNNGRTPLEWAARNGRKGVVLLLTDS